MNKIRLFLRGYFQCSPDSFEPRMKSVMIESKELHDLFTEGFEVIGAEKPPEGQNGLKENKE